MVFIIAFLILFGLAKAQTDSSSCYISTFWLTGHQVKLELTNLANNRCNEKSNYHLKGTKQHPYIAYGGRKLYVGLSQSTPDSILKLFADKFDFANEPIEYGEPLLSANVSFIIDADGTVLARGMSMGFGSKYFNAQISKIVRELNCTFKPLIIDGLPVLSIQTYHIMEPEMGRFWKP